MATRKYGRRSPGRSPRWSAWSPGAGAADQRRVRRGRGHPGPAPAEAALGALANDETRNTTLAAIGQAFPPGGWARQAAVPFSSARKWSAASFAGHGTWILGAPELVLPGSEREHLSQAAG